MIRATVEIREHAVVRRVRITSESLERALSMIGKGSSEREIHLISPVEAERFFAENEGQKPSLEINRSSLGRAA